MSLSEFSLRHKPIITAAVMILMLAGVLVYNSISRREDPEYVVRACLVLTDWPGTPVTEVEELVTAPLEREISGLDGVRWVRSVNTPGKSEIYVELDRATPGDEVAQMWDRVRSRVERVPMPSKKVVPLVIDDFGDTNVQMLTLHQRPLPGDDEVRPENRYSFRDIDVFSKLVADELKLVDGVAKVSRYGVRKEVVYLEVDGGRWSQLSLTKDQLSQLLDRRNVVASGGSFDAESGRFFVKPSGRLDTVREINSVVVGTAGEEGSEVPVQLEDLGIEVRRTYQDPPGELCRYGDREGSYDCVAVAFSMKAGSNIVAVCAHARETVVDLQENRKVLPPDLAVHFVHDQSINVTRKIDDFIWNVIGAIVLVVIVVFLMVGLRSAVVMAANIPLVILASLACFPLVDVQMEQISLAAMIIALGMLVDNAVQICDQTRRLLSEGKSAFEAAKQGAEQLSFPILIATGTTIGAFFPMLIGLQGGTREYIRSLPISITITLGLSYVLAMSFCVLLAYWFIKPAKDPTLSLSPVIALFQLLGRRLKKGKGGGADPSQKKAGLFSRLFPMAVGLAIRGRIVVLAISAVLLVAVTRLPVGSEFFPKDLRDQFAIDIWLPEGASIEQTDVVAGQVEEILRKLSPGTDAEGNAVERLLSFRTSVGSGGGRWYLGRSPEPQKPSFAELMVRTTDGALTSAYAAQLRRVFEQGDEELGIAPIVGARVIPRELVMGPAVDAPIGIRLFGPNAGASFADERLMREHGHKLMNILRAQEGTWDVYDSWGSPSYQLHVDVDEDRANLAGVTNQAVADSLNAYLSGHLLTTFLEGDHRVPVYLRLPPEQREGADGLRSVWVEGEGGKVPLLSVAEIEPRWEPARFERRFQQRVLEVRARVEDGYLANDIVNEILKTPEYENWKADLPPGYWVEIGGEMFESQQSRGELGVSVVISMLIIVLLLIVQYNGIVKPIIILSTLPLALIGALPGLYFTGNPLGFMPQLGLLALFGIVVNTAIIFLEFADDLIREKVKASDGSGPVMGISRSEFIECLVQAGQLRLLPIAMTTLTTIGGLLPLALAGGPLWEGMAWLMIFGLVVATVLTLVVVPSLYALFVLEFKMRPLPRAIAASEPKVAGA